MAILLLVGILFLGRDYILYPWQLSIPGRGALVGEWVGKVKGPEGGEREVSMEILKPEAGADGPVGAEVELRLEGDVVENYTAAGAALEWDGSRFTLIARERGSSGAVRPGYRLGFVDGAWSGDELNLKVYFNYLDEDGRISKGAWAGSEWSERNKYPLADKAFPMRMGRRL